MKQFVLVFISLLPISMMAQVDDINPLNHTTPVHAWLLPLSDLNVDSIQKTKDRRMVGYRVLEHEHAAFGVLFVSCWNDYRMVYYDSLAHALVYKQEMAIKNDKSKMTTKIAIPDGHARRLSRLWSGAISCAKYPETAWAKCRDDKWEFLFSMTSFCLDGEDTEFFFHDKRAVQECSNGNGRVEALMRFTRQLMEAVQKNNAGKVDSLMTVAEFIAPLFDGLNTNTYDHDASLFVLPSSIIQPKTHLQKLSEAERKDYLTKKAAEVTTCFSSGYTPAPPVEYEVSELKTFNTADFVSQSRKQKGRKFYEVTIRYAASAQKSWPFKSKVAIWEDDGEPLGIIFGNHYGHNFFVNPYHEWIKHNVTQRMPLP